MRRTAALMALVLAGTACGAPPSTTTSTSSSTTTTLAPPSTTTTIPLPAFGAVAATEIAIEGLPEGPLLLAGIGRRLGRAYDDIGGGIVFEQLVEGTWQVWHLEAGRREPIEFGVPGARLGDVDFLADRPVTVAMWSPEAILVQVLKGGAPDVLLLDDLDIADEVSGVSLGGTALAVATEVDDCHDVRVFTLDGELVLGPLGLCATTPPEITSAGLFIVHLDVGTSTRVVFLDATTGEEVARHQVSDDAFAVTATTRGAVVTRPDGVDEVVVEGPDESLDWDPTGTPLVATAVRAPLAISDLATLGGEAIPTDCSAAGLPNVAAQTGLSPAADTTRNALVAASRACAYWALARLAGPDFDGPDALALTIISAEADGIPVTADIVRTLGLPHAARGSSPDIEFIWPSILGDEPTDEDWAMLRLVYNEERIEEWRTGRGPFDGLSITIAEDGTWTSLGGVDDR